MNAVKPSTSFSGSLGTSRREALGIRLSGLWSPSPTHDYESPLTGGVRWRWFNCVKTTRKHRGVQSEHRVLIQDSCAVSSGGSRSLAWHKVKMLLKTLTSILQFKWSTIISSSVQCKISTLPCREVTRIRRDVLMKYQKFSKLCIKGMICIAIRILSVEDS